MNDLQKLEWIHSQISELINGNEIELNVIQKLIEDVRESFFKKAV